MKKIKNRHIIVVCPGHTLSVYKNKVLEYIGDSKKNVTFGCNNLYPIFIPDYHFWADNRRYGKFGKNISSKSVPIFSDHFTKKGIKRHWKGKYLEFSYIKRKWKESYEDISSPKYGCGNIDYRDGVMNGVFRTVGSLAIFYAYIKGASKITVVGMDGYTLYEKEELKDRKVAQHCYGEGMTDGRFTYKYEQKKDRDIYKTLRLLALYGEEHYGFKFEIITPTVYSDFYNPDILKV